MPFSFSTFTPLRWTGRLLMVAALMAGAVGSSQAQVALGFSFAQVRSTYVPITGGTQLGSTTSNDEQFNDLATATAGSLSTAPGPGLPIGFSFAFNGDTYDRFAVNTNGWIALGKSADGASAVTALLPNFSSTNPNDTPIQSPASPPTNIIAGFARNLAGQTGSSLTYQVMNTAPARILVVQWSNFRFPSTTERINFQIRLNEVDNSIVYSYGAMSITFSRNAIVGLRGASNTDYLTRTTRSPSTSGWTISEEGISTISSMAVSSLAYPLSGLRYTFTPLQCFSPASVTVSNITPTGARLTFTPTFVATSYTITLTPAGGTATTISPAPTTSPVTLTGLLPGMPYTVTLAANCAGGTTAPPATATFTTRADNDECATATPLPVGTPCTLVAANTTNASPSANTPNNLCHTSGINDVWYSVVVPPSGTVTVTTSALTGSNVTDTVLELFTGSCGSLVPLGCNYDGPNSLFATYTATGLAPGTVISVLARVYGNSGRFNICAQGMMGTATRNSLAGGEVRIYPNPATRQATLALPALADGHTAQVVLRNALGQVVQAQTVALQPAGTAVPLALAGLPAGVYAVAVAAGAETAVVRLVVE